MKYQLFNSKVVDSQTNVIDTTNRSFRYGDGFFESMKVANGKVLFADLHWNRLVHACSILRINIPKEFTVDVFRAESEKLARLNAEQHSRIRFQGFRAGAGRYTPDTSVLNWIMTSEPIENAEYTLNQKGLCVGVCDAYSINPLPQSGFKSCNAVPYVLGGIYASQKGWDDCLMLDAEGFIAEGTGSNVFLVQGNVLVTPTLENGGVPGVMRSVLMHLGQESSFEVSAKLVTEDDLLSAHECFLTTATRGITWVSAFQKKRYFKKTASKLVEQLNRRYINP
jgi:branched-chain amino acid aminotransferase